MADARELGESLRQYQESLRRYQNDMPSSVQGALFLILAVLSVGLAVFVGQRAPGLGATDRRGRDRDFGVGRQRDQGGQSVAARRGAAAGRVLRSPRAPAFS